MARFLPLKAAGALFWVVAFAGCLALFPVSGATNAPAAKPPPPPAPPPPDDYYIRYGKIIRTSDQSIYPFKLAMPFPSVGEVKVPSQEELDVRDKVERLANLSDDEIRDQLVKWPAFAKMSLADDGAMLERLQLFRDYRNHMAQEEAHRLGLLTLNPSQQARFETEYWTKKLQMDRQLAQQLEPIYKAAQQKLNQDLYREFSSPTPLGQAPPATPAKKPAPKPVVAASTAPKPPALATP